MTCREEGCKVIKSAPVTLNTAGTLHKAWWKPKAYILVGNHLALASNDRHGVLFFQDTISLWKH